MTSKDDEYENNVKSACSFYNYFDLIIEAFISILRKAYHREKITKL